MVLFIELLLTGCMNFIHVVCEFLIRDITVMEEVP